MHVLIAPIPDPFTANTCLLAPQVVDTANSVMRTYQEQLGGLQPSNASLVHDNLAALEAFLLTYDMQEPDSSTASDAQRQLFDQGKDLYGKLWRADELEQKMNDEMDKQGQVNAPAKVLGPSNMAPWGLAFVAPEAQFIWGVEGGNINMDPGTSLLTLTKTVSLGNPDLFDLILSSSQTTIATSSSTEASWAAPYIRRYCFLTTRARPLQNTWARSTRAT